MDIQEQRVKSIAFYEDEIDIFHSIIAKIYKESQKVGFKNMFTKEEKEIIIAMYVNNKENNIEND